MKNLVRISIGIIALICIFIAWMIIQRGPEISGYVRYSDGKGIDKVQIRFITLDSTETAGAKKVSFVAETKGSGKFSLRVPKGWSGIATPIMQNLEFYPSSRAYRHILSSLSDENFVVGEMSLVTISGFVRNLQNQGIGGVEINFTSGVAAVTTDSTGSYSQTVPVGWSGTATPFKEGFQFVPRSIEYETVTSDLSNKNFTYTGQPEPPNTPSRLTVTTRGDSAVVLNWRINSTNQKGFLIERIADGDSVFTIIGTSSVATWTDSSVIPGTRYTWVIRALGSSSAGSNPQTADVPDLGQPVNPRAIVSGGTIHFTWGNTSNGFESGHKIDVIKVGMGRTTFEPFRCTATGAVSTDTTNSTFQGFPWLARIYPFRTKSTCNAPNPCDCGNAEVLAATEDEAYFVIQR